MKILGDVDPYYPVDTWYTVSMMMMMMTILLNLSISSTYFNNHKNTSQHGGIMVSLIVRGHYILRSLIIPIMGSSEVFMVIK